MSNPKRYPVELRERSVRLVFEQQSTHESQWATICSIAGKIGCAPETLRAWVREAERNQGLRPGLTTEERQHLKDLGLLLSRKLPAFVLAYRLLLAPNSGATRSHVSTEAAHSHLANANKFDHIRRINTLLGLFVPALVTPLELTGEDDVGS